MTQHQNSASAHVGTRQEWRAARLALLAKEKELNRLRDQLAALGFEAMPQGRA